jgi:hypothetical protein
MTPEILSGLGKKKMLPERTIKTNLVHNCGVATLRTVRTRYYINRDGLVIYARADQPYLLVVYCVRCGYHRLLN